MRGMRVYPVGSHLFLAAVFVIGIFAWPASGTVIFEDDFESGNLDMWTVTGRQLGMANVADVVERNGSEMGHLYHQGFTGISLLQTFDYDESLAFSFDFEAEVSGDNYSSGEARFYFLDSSENILGSAGYIKATSNYVFEVSNPNPEIHIFQIAEGTGLETYSVTAQELLSNIVINEDLIASVILRFNAYGSVNHTDYQADIWVDNVSVRTTPAAMIPEPATIAILAFGAVMFGKRK
ncbi:MAG: PEP-CTERM sorting domain-containing protein [Sedimentisphaerales bacterium]|nr:PEP-CTERM sorting domain-containing protein [Sedimentisphaerales bacterium]